MFEFHIFIFNILFNFIFKTKQSVTKLPTILNVTFYVFCHSATCWASLPTDSSSVVFSAAVCLNVNKHKNHHRRKENDALLI